MNLDAIWIVAGGLIQVPVIECAKSLGLKAIVSDRNPDAPVMKLADRPVPIDIYDIESHLEMADKLTKEYRIKAAFTAGADVEVTVACLADRLRLPGIGIESALRCKNKAMMRSRCNMDRRLAWAQTWHYQVSSCDLVKLLPIVSFPCVVKPVDNCGSRGLSKVENAALLPQAVAEAIQASTTGTCLIEECLKGDEQTVEVIFDRDGKWHPVNICDRLFREFGMEEGHVNPSRLLKDRQADIYQKVATLGDSFGIRNGIFKCDTILTHQGFRLLECTARLSGGFDSTHTQPLAYGNNPVRAAMRLALGDHWFSDDLQHQHEKHSACLGTYRPVEVEEGNLFFDLDIKRFIRTGKGGGDQDCTDRTGFVITQSETREVALAAARKGLEYLEK